jgi:septum formation protein
MADILTVRADLGNVTIVSTTEHDHPRLVLASASPARCDLRAAGIEPEVPGERRRRVRCGRHPGGDPGRHAGPDEGRGGGRAPADPGPPTHERRLVLGCDSVLAFDGEILGKPADAAEAVRRWHAMRGGRACCHTGHCLIDLETGKNAEAVSATVVRFADITDAEINAYVATGEPIAVAGRVHHRRLGGWFLESISGDAGTVIGVSLPTLRRLLAEHGLTVAELWTPAP